MADKFYGDNPRWFVGIVVNHTPPPGNEGYVKVRIRGIHSSHTVDIPEADLPWAQVMVPTTEHSSSGLGKNTKITTGATVFGVFMDGKDSQIPLILGSLPKDESKNTLQNKIKPTSDYPFIDDYESLVVDMNSTTRVVATLNARWTKTYSNEFIMMQNLDSVDYHYLILRDGTIQKGASLDKDTLDSNSITVGFVGGYNCPTETKNPGRFLSIQSLTRSQFSSYENIARAFFSIEPFGSLTGESEIDSEFNFTQYEKAIFLKGL